MIFEDDVVIDGNFDNWFQKIREKENIEDGEYLAFLLFTKDLTVNGDIEIYDFHIAVLGNLTCDYFYASGEGPFNLVVGDAIVKYAVSFEGNDSYTDILGKTIVPFFYNCDCAVTADTGKNTVSLSEFNPYSDGYDFVISDGDIEKFIKPKYLKEYKNELCFNFNLFLKALKQGKSPFINISDEDFTLKFDKKELLKKIS